jgi:hypothetical protein
MNSNLLLNNCDSPQQTLLILKERETCLYYTESIQA